MNKFTNEDIAKARQLRSDGEKWAVIDLLVKPGMRQAIRYYESRSIGQGRGSMMKECEILEAAQLRLAGHSWRAIAARYILSHGLVRHQVLKHLGETA